MPRQNGSTLRHNHLAMTSFEPIVISTGSLTLRFLSEADLPAVYGIFSHPEVMRYWSYPPWTDISQAQQWLIKVEEGYRTRNDLQFGIERNADQVLMGTCTLFQFHAASRR